jgi:hypothetical protein
MQSLTNAEILGKLQSDYEFGINFIIDNNPQAIEANLNANNFTLQPNPTKSQLKAKIDEIIGLGQKELAIEILQVPYLNQNPNYTGNLEEPLKELAKQSGNPQPRAIGLAIITLVTTIGGGILAIKTQQAQQENLELQQQIAQTQLAIEQEESKQNSILGLPKGVFYGLIGLIALVFIIIAIRK